MILCIYQSRLHLFVFVLRFFLRPIVQVRNTLILPGRFFLLILSYLNTKDVLFGNVLARQLVFQVLFYLSPLPSTSSSTFYFNIGFAISPTNGAALDAISPIRNPFSLCLYHLFLPPICQTPFFTDCFTSF